MQDNPRYNTESFRRVIVLVNPDYDVEPSKSHPLTHASVIDLKTDGIYEGEFFSAIGFRAIPEITREIPETSKNQIPDYKKQIWAAPKDLPVGSLLESYMQWLETTNNMAWAYEPQAYHRESFAQLLSNYIKDNGINIKDTVVFFNRLDHNIKALATSVNDNACLEIFVTSYKEAYNASRAETSQFKDVLRKMFSDKDNIELHKAQP